MNIYPSASRACKYATGRVPCDLPYRGQQPLKEVTMRPQLSISSLLFVGALTGSTGYAQADAGLGTGETSQQKSQQGVGLEGADSSSVILGGPEMLYGRIEKIEGNDFLVQADHGQFMKLQLTKDTNIVCAKGSEATLTTGRQGMQEHAEIPISPATEEQMNGHDPSNLNEQLNLLNDPNRQQAEYETPAPSKDPSSLKGVVGSTDEAANKDIAHGSGFVVGSSDCFKRGDLVRIEASDVGTMTTIAQLPYEQEESGSQIATEKEEEMSKSVQ
jgi:hypothetical protein